MKPIAFLTIPLLLANHAAFAGSVDGNGALALAALVAEHSPNVKASGKTVLAKFLNGQTNVPYPPNKKIAVAAGAVACRASNVDITQHSCDLTWSEKSRDAGQEGARTLRDSRRGGRAAGRRRGFDF